MDNLDTPLKPEESPKRAEKTCVEDMSTLKLSPNSLRLIVITIRRALIGAVKLCDQLVEQLKIK